MMDSLVNIKNRLLTFMMDSYTNVIRNQTMSGETFPMKSLYRDGKFVMKGSEIAILDYIHNNHCYSMDHALKYEGYSVTPA